MRIRSRIVCCLIVVMAAMGASPARVQGRFDAADLSDEIVQKAIDSMVTELYARKHAERFWEPEKIPAGDSTRQRGGYTAITVLALLYAGQSYQDPRLRDAIEYLAAFDMEGTYAVSLRANVWAKLPPKFRDKLTADTQWLLDGFSEGSGGWDYDQNPRTSRKDNSIRQFGALALWESAKRGLKIEKRYWQKLEDAYIDAQLASGGWNYTGDGPPTGSMTAAGLATLFITQDFLHATDAIKIGGERNSRHQHALDNGLKWMDENFSPTENPGKNTYFYYYLWGVERVGLASGYKVFGSHDWYREGAAELIRRLCKWDESSRTFSVFENTGGDGRRAKIKTDDLAFALLFLSRGRVPVAINKLAFPGAGNWNNRPRDVANLTNWIHENSETDLNWQIVDLSAEPDAWLDAPMLYIASHEPLPWMKSIAVDASAFARDAKDFLRKRAAGDIPADAKPPAGPDTPELIKLKRYLDLGGMIFAVNEGPSKNFAESIEKAGLLMYPQYEWRTLPDDHWAYTIHAQVKTHKPVLRGLSNGVRELIIVAPSGDLAETFQKNDAKQASDYHTATNIYFYASELNRPRPRLAQHNQASGIASQPQGSVTIVRAIHEENWKPEPLALPVFAAWLANHRGIQVKIIDHPLSKIHELNPAPQLVIVSGIDEHTFSQVQIDAIRAYVESGGIILFETPGGRGNFTASAEQVAAGIFGRSAESLVRSRVITGEGLAGAIDLTRIDYRPFSFQAFGTRDTAPRLRGMTIKDGSFPRGAQLLFSREDISNALLNQPRWGISGYAPPSARDLLGNIVQHAMKQ